MTDNERNERLKRKLLHAIAMQKRSTSRVKRATTILQKWSAMRRRIERAIGQAEVQRIVDSEQAIAEITKQKNTVRRTVKRLSEAK
jgi:hypothetical protein